MVPQAPGAPKNAVLDASVVNNNSTMSWTADPHAAAWRSTDEPFWTMLYWLVLVAKDNVDFGVRAVGQNGLRSPSTLPLPG